MPLPIAVTTRTKTVTDSGTLDCSVVAAPSYPSTSFPLQAAPFIFASFGQINNDPRFGGSIPLIQFSVQGQANGTTGAQSTHISIGFQDNAGLTTTGGAPGTGAWSYSVDMEEVRWFAVEGLSGGTDLQSAFTGETCLPHGMVFATLRPKLGGSYSITCFGQTLSGTITAAQASRYVSNPNTASTGGFNATFEVAMHVQTSGGGSTTSQGSITGSFFGQIMGRAATHSSVSGSDTLLEDFTNGCLVRFSGSALNNNFSNQIATGSFQQWVPIPAQVNGVVSTAPPGTEPNTLKALAWNTSSAGTFSPLITPLTFNPSNSTSFSTLGAVVANGLDLNAGFISIVAESNWPGIQIGLDVSDATTATECYINSTSGGLYDSRVPLRLKSCDGPILTQAARITLDPCNSISTPGTWTGVTVVGGVLRIDTAVHTAAVGTYTSPLLSRQGRYLALKIKPGSTSAATLTVKITMVKGVITYPAVTGASGSYTDVVIDLCGCPGQVGPDYQYSRYTNPANQEGPTWGANTISKIEIDFPAASGFYDIGEIALKVFNPPRISTMCAPVGPFVPGFPGTIYQLGTIVDVDGRRAFEQVAATTQGSVVYARVTDMLSSLDPGWTGSYAGGTEWYRPPVPYICYMGGGGAVFSGSATSWNRKEWTMTSAIPLQMMVDGIVGYPDMGDLLNMGSAAGPLILYGYKILRGSWSGVVFDTSALPVSGLAVNAVVGASSTGTGTTDSYGRYILGTPGTQVPPINTITAGTLTAAESNNQRQDRRIGFIGATPATSAFSWILQDNYGRLHLASVVSGNLMYYRSSFGAPNLPWQSIGTVSATGDVLAGRMAIDPRLRTIWMYFERDNSGTRQAYSSFSDDDGATWSTPVLFVTVGAPYQVSTGFNGDGDQWVVWAEYVSGTSGPMYAKGQFRNRAESTFSATFSFEDSTGTPIQVGDQQMCNVEMVQASSQAWSWMPTISGDSEPTYWVSYDKLQSWIKP